MWVVRVTEISCHTLKKRATVREKVLRGKWLRLSQECMRSGRQADDCVMDAFGAAAAQTLTHAALHVGVRVILICQISAAAGSLPKRARAPYLRVARPQPLLQRPNLR